MTRYRLKLAVKEFGRIEGNLVHRPQNRACLNPTEPYSLVTIPYYKMQEPSVVYAPLSSICYASYMHPLHP